MRDLLGQAKPAVAPLALDPLTARIAEQAGFDLVYVSGGALGYSYGVSEALLSITEVADVTRRITGQSSLNVIVDIGVGFGDPVHVARTMQEMEAAGACAVEVEDQVAPKRVSHHRGIEHLVASELMVEKIREAVSARKNHDLLIIARTGAIKNESFGAAMERLAAYADAGADVLMCMPENEEQAKQLRDDFIQPLATITAMDQANTMKWEGWDLIIDPFTAQVLAVQAVKQAYLGFMQNGSTGVDLKILFENYHELDLLAGLGPLYDIEDRTTEK